MAERDPNFVFATLAKIEREKYIYILYREEKDWYKDIESIISVLNQKENHSIDWVTLLIN